MQPVMGVTTHAALHVAGAPRSLTVAHDPADGQLVGHEPSIAASQASTGVSTRPSPQTGAQSASIKNVAPDGQHPSPATAAVTGRCTQAASQVPADSRRSSVQGLPSSHARGQAPRRPAAMATSQASPTWTTPSPQVVEQSGSWAALQPAGQQP